MSEPEPTPKQHAEPVLGAEVLKEQAEAVERERGREIGEANRQIREQLKHNAELDIADQVSERAAKLRKIAGLRREAARLRGQSDRLFEQADRIDYLPSSVVDRKQAQELYKEANSKEASANLLEQELTSAESPN